ncbi:hypothetical protein FITA111629_07815 [Filibacter tadaridae]|uniref:Uncharacterized protein n=1 Tax=Filibacter tadaridae TaxID=2483811 RepID=A0A3P5XKL4_9BACL|nr:hypothetical protein [Filibacter tadaridae]VDC28223.1 hypothetical protein FILTAD_01837 [Filibacter tadaridae]
MAGIDGFDGVGFINKVLLLLFLLLLLFGSSNLEKLTDAPGED